MIYEPICPICGESVAYYKGPCPKGDVLMATKPKPKPEDEPDPESTEVQSQTTRERQTTTFGERAVGINFNPSADPTVQKLKELYAEIIDICDKARTKVNQGRITAAAPVEAARLWSIAITEAQGGPMWAVKAATWRD